MTNGQQDGDRKKKEEWKEGRVKRGGNRVKRRGKERNDIENISRRRRLWRRRLLR